MAYYPVIQVEDILNACKAKIGVLCSLYALLDEYRKIVLMMYLVEYIVIKNRREDQIRDDKYYISHDDTIEAYELSMKNSVGILLGARDLTMHLPDTPKQKKAWDRAWTDGHIERVLKYEGFL